VSTIRVKAAPGRMCPIHKSVATAPGNRMLVIDDATERDLPDVSYVRRRINAGDLVVVDPAAAKPAAPAPLPPPPTAATKES